MAEADAQETKCVKRRRRSPSLVALCTEQRPPQTFQLDQTTTTTTTTKRSSRFRGVSRHRWTGRFEAHLWDKGSWNETQKKKGKQVYLGAYDEEEAAARVYDLAAIKYWGASTYTNFPICDYKKDIEIMQNMSKEEYLGCLRRRSSGLTRGVSKYRGVARQQQNGRWEARIGRKKYVYLGTEEEAAHAYHTGMNAVELSTYIRWLQDEPQPKFMTIKNPEIIERKMPLSPWSKAAAPSALSLLLRSSLFKELLHKTTTTAVAAAGNQDDHFARLANIQLETDV